MLIIPKNRCADQLHIPLDLQDTLSPSQITSEAIIAHDTPSAKDHRAPLVASDVIVEYLTLTFAMKDRNPMDHITFYTKYDTQKSLHVPKEHVSSFIPNHFKEVLIRVFVRDATKAVRVQDAFRRYLKSINASLLDDETEIYEEDVDDNIKREPDESKIDESEFVAPSLAIPFSKATPMIDISARNPFYVPSSPFKSNVTRSSSKASSPTKSVLEPSPALTLPKNFHEIVEDSPARKRKRIPEKDHI
jgi:hypothetical protein